MNLILNIFIFISQKFAKLVSNLRAQNPRYVFHLFNQNDFCQARLCMFL